jgi:hypothetical protein
MTKTITSFLLFTLIYLLHSQLNAQSITIGNGTFINSNLAGPMYSSINTGSHSRYAYIFPESLLNNLQQGDSIRSLSFLKNGIGNIIGTCSLKIYLRTTINSNYGARNVVWNNQINATGMKLFYNQSPANVIGSNPGWKSFVLDSAFVYDTLLGKNIEMLVEYYQASNQNNNVFWSYENGNSINSYTFNQTKFIRVNNTSMPDSTNSSSDIHPTIRINFPRKDFDISTSKIYSLGKIPVPLGNPDSVRAIIRNIGKKAANNFKVYLLSKGANNLIDSGVYSLNVNEERLIDLPLIYPSVHGIDSLYLKFGNAQDRRVSNPYNIRLANENTYSYRDITQPIAGGIGFNGGTGDFVAKFFLNSLKSINQISVSFAIANQRFQLGVWNVDSTTGAPRQNIWTSDTLISANSFVTPVIPPVNVLGNFFVGVKQIGTQNVAFGYQPDVPTRSKTFYYTTPTGGTNWVDFAPGAPFKFVIEPRLQKANDVAPINLVFPKDTINLNTVVTMAPKARILNYGANNQLTPFTTSLIISRNNNIVYTSNKQDTLSSGLYRTITFDSTFLPTLAGDYSVLIITRLNNDEQKDNDTLRTRIVVATYNDVGLGSVFDPSSFFDYEQNIDTIYPTVFVQNFGLDSKGPFNVTAQIYDSLKNLLYTRTKSYSLAPLNSILATFDPFPCDKKGVYFFRAYTQLNNDVNKRNDSAFRIFNIIKSNDVGVSKIIYPENQKSLSPPVASKRPEITVDNFGDLNQNLPFKVFCEIYNSGNLIYKDSSTTNSFRGVTNSVFFKFFQPTQIGYYQLKAYTNLPDDQQSSNDTLISNFAVGIPDDIEIVSISPINSFKAQINQSIAPKATFVNKGLNRQTTPFPVVFQVFDNGNPIYSSTKFMTLDSGASKSITFDSTLRFNKIGSFQVVAYSALGIDFISKNDSFDATYFARVNYDIGISNILNPLNNDTLLVNLDVLKPKIELENLGDSIYNTGFTISTKFFNHTTNDLLYSKDIDTFFIANNPLILDFPDFPIQTTEKDVRMEAIIFSNKDQLINNNFKSLLVRYHLFKDVSAANIVLPENGKIYLVSDASVLPRITLENKTIYKTESLMAALKIEFIDSLNNATQVHSDSVLIQSLSAKEIQTLNMNKPFSFADKSRGNYKGSLIVNSMNDQIVLNNIYTINFRIQESLNISQINSNYFQITPIPANQYLKVISKNEDLLKQIKLFDINGRMLIQQTVNTKEAIVNVSDLASGIYFIEVDNLRYKIIVSH